MNNKMLDKNDNYARRRKVVVNLTIIEKVWIKSRLSI